MAAAGALLGYLLYLFTLICFFLLLAGAFVVVMELLTAPAERNRTLLLFAALAAAGFGAGATIGWYSVVPPTWSLGFWESVRASVDTVTYSHAVEHVAERLVLFAIFTGDLGAIAGLGAVLICRRKRPRLATA